MVWLANLILKIGSTAPGQAFLSWVVTRAWDVITEKSRKEIAKRELDAAITKALADYEQVIKDQNLLAADGLTEEEKNEIRKRKAKIQSSIVNMRP